MGGADRPLQRRDDHLVIGTRAARLFQYDQPAFFTVVNYEQVVADAPDINARVRPDIVILDEAQRIKNWQTKTARAVKSLDAPYAFVLTGTPLENRIDEVYSIVQYLDPGCSARCFVSIAISTNSTTAAVRSTTRT